MKQLSSAIAGICFVLSGCSSATDADDTTLPIGGSSGASSGVAGAPSAGAASAGAPGSSGAATSGAGGDAGGASTVAGAGGSTASAGTSGAAATGGNANGGSANGGAATGGSGSAGQSGTGEAIDYSIWVLQLPIGPTNSPTTISSKQLLAGFENEYFYPADDGGQIFMDPETGTTTSGSQHCRSEMRESTTSGGQAAWASSGINTMTVTGKVLKVGGGASGNVIVGQLFNGSDSIPLIELEYNTGKAGFQLLYEEAKGGGSTTNLNTKVALNTQYTFTLSLTRGVATVNINGKDVYTKMPSAGILAKKFYFKFGAYDQSASLGPESTTPYTLVEAYQVDVVHQ